MTATRRSAVRAARDRRRRAATRPIRPPVVTVHRPSHHRPGRDQRPRLIVRLARSVSMDVRTALEAARLVTAGEIDIVMEPVAALPGGAPFSLRTPWHPIDAPAGSTRDEGEAMASFAAAFETALQRGPRP